MGDRWETRLSALENVQEKLIREMEEQLTRLTSLFEDMTTHPRGPSPLAHQQVPRPSVQTTSYLPRRTNRPNLRQPRPTALPAFVATSRHANQSSASSGQPSRRKIDRDNLRWDSIPITYAKLLPKLIDNGSIVPIRGKPHKPPFPKWYDINTRCNYHSGVLGHSVEDCSALKREVQNLIKGGRLKFEEPNRPAGLENPSRVRVNMTRQKREALKEASTEKAKMLMDRVPIAKTRRSEAGHSQTTERSKEKMCELIEEEKKRALQDLV